MNRKNTDKLMDMLGLNETLDKMAIGSGVRWFGHVLRRDESNVLRKALQFEVDGQRGRGRPRNTWKKGSRERNVKSWFEKRGCT